MSNLRTDVWAIPHNAWDMPSMDELLTVTRPSEPQGREEGDKAMRMARSPLCVSLSNAMHADEPCPARIQPRGMALTA